MSAEDNSALCLSKMIFLNKFLILEYRGLSVQNGSKDLPNFGPRVYLRGSLVIALVRGSVGLSVHLLVSL